MPARRERREASAPAPRAARAAERQPEAEPPIQPCRPFRPIHPDLTADARLGALLERLRQDHRLRRCRCLQKRAGIMQRDRRIHTGGQAAEGQPRMRGMSADAAQKPGIFSSPIQKASFMLVILGHHARSRAALLENLTRLYGRL